MNINKQLYKGDCLTIMSNLIKEGVKIDGVITSPPYNICTKRKDVYYNNGYSDTDNLTEDNYINIRVSEFKKMSELLKDKGVICYNLSYHNENPMLPFKLITEMNTKTDLTVADVIIWKKPHSIPFQTSPTKLSRICEMIFVIVKKEHLHNFKTNKEISTINKKTNQKFYKNYTNFIEAPNNDRVKTSHKATYSTELCDKLINIYFEEGSLILDPFGGIGTTMKSCIKNNLKNITIELNEEFYKHILNEQKISDINP